MATVVFDSATRSYQGSEAPAVAALDLDIADGEFVVLVGPSGSGKSTALRMLAGLEPTDSGRILIGGRDVRGVRAKERDVAMVFQTYALYPHMSVAGNIGFSLRLQKRPKREIAQRVRDVARLLDLEKLLDRKPESLSGGQRQRVAMGRAIVREPAVFLMDEPLSNLDAQLRVSTRAQIAALQRRIGTTTLYVTHDQVEAMTMGDRVAVLSGGVLQQCDTPRALYARPANVFVAGFIGSPSMNLIESSVNSDGTVTVGPLTLPLTPGQRSKLGSSSVIIGFRPDDLALGAADDSIQATVEVVEELGSDAYAYVASELVPHALLAIRIDSRQVPARGATVGVRALPDRMHVFDGATGIRVP
jgi:multiple sugar transport system ATP-binding protein